MDETLDEPCGQTPSERRSYRRYLVEFLISMAVYSVAVVVSVMLRQPHTNPSLAVALIPEIGVLAATATMVRFALRMDEMQRRIAIDAAAFSAVVTVVVCMGLGFAENASGIPHISMIWTFPIAGLTWGAALPLMRRRYA
jgi:heme/copper-type cytochrome/quinol oxidase subunit 4